MIKLFIIIVIFYNPIKCGHQYITVEGRLFCYGEPIPNLKVELYEEDVLYDDLLNSNYTDNEGDFELSGVDEEFSQIDPYIKFTYTCPIYEEKSLNDVKILYVPSNVFRYYGYIRDFYFNFGSIDLKIIKKRVY
uniref:Transthyretin-like family-containing protein n=1 Tax=Parastrongyloides trichosuri TaxID=131310 RepID=A0A0N4ZXZ1_PARTI